MKTISAEQFKTKFGEAGVAQFSAPVKQEGGYLSKVAEQVKGNVKEASQSLDASSQGKMNPLAAGANIAKNISGAVLAPVSQVLKPIFDKTVTPITDAIVGTQPAQRLIDVLSKNPELVGAIADTLETGLNVAGIEGTISQFRSGINFAKKTINDIKATPTEPPPGGPTNPEIMAQNKAKIAMEDATPAYSKKMIGEPAIKNPDGTFTSRVSEGGIIEGRKINPTKLELEAGEALSKIENYPEKGTSLEKYQSVQPEITKQSGALAESLKNENILRPPKEVSNVVKKAINQATEESLLLQKTDPIIQNYMRALDNAIKANDGTLLGEMKVRQAMDSAYRNARGKAAFGSERMSALDEIHTAARDSLNQDIISHARSTDVKAALKSQWDLMRASDVLRAKAEAEAGNAVGRVQQKYPLTTKAVKAVGNATGIGGVINVLNP